jgi:hypothetical protein
LKVGVRSRAGGTVRWHPSYEAMAVGYGFQPLAHFPMRPKTKGRVERIVRFTRERFFVGRAVGNLESFNDEALTWLHDRANSRIHRITRERPCDRFTIERQALQPLRNFDIVLEESRVADAYALANVDGVRYSVPANFARRPLTLQRRRDGLTFLVDRSIVAQHEYAKPGQRLVQDPAHLPPAPRPRHERFARLSEQVVEQFGDLGHRYTAAIEKAAPHAPLALLNELLDRQREYGTDLVAGILESLVQLRILKRGALSRLCHRVGQTPRLDLEHIRPIPSIEVEQRSLAAYDEAAA